MLDMIEKYEKYLKIAGSYIDKYFEQQKPYIHCKKGCSLCCECGEYPFTRLEMEYLMSEFLKLDEKTKNIIRKKITDLKKEKQKAIKKNEKFLYQCPFLIDKKCSIYSHRGLICRNHGLMTMLINSKQKETFQIPYCANNGLNYSIVYDKKRGTISKKLWEKSGIEQEPLSYNVGLDYLLNNEFTKELELDFGDQLALIDWF